MKYILIRGSKDSGKSTTFDAVCKQLNPNKILVLRRNNGTENAFFEEVNTSIIVYNETYIIEVGHKLILIMAGSPTEQYITITIVIEICIRLKIKIDFVLIAMRSFEKIVGFNTTKELEILGEAVLIENIYRIDDSEFKKTKIWKLRIEQIVTLIKENI